MRERRRLRRIGKAVRRTDPQLAAMLAIFSKLSAKDAMPGHERLHTPPSPASPPLMR